MYGWLAAVKQGRRGDIMTVYILSLIKGVQTCIHLCKGKGWSTLYATPLHHVKLIDRCKIHLAYLGFAIFLRLVRHPPPMPKINILGTIHSDGPATLHELASTTTVLPGTTQPGTTQSSAATGSTTELAKIKSESHAKSSQSATPPQPGKPTPITSITRPRMRHAATATAAAGSAANLPRVETEIQAQKPNPVIPKNWSNMINQPNWQMTVNH